MGKGSKARPKRRVPAVTRMPKDTAILTRVTAVPVIVTGVVMYLSMTQYLYRLVAWFPADRADMLHTYAGFVMAGLSVAHLYLNRNSVKSYIRILK